MTEVNSFNEEAKQLQVTVADAATYSLNAEAQAMMSAVCSRSKEGPQHNLAMVKEKGADAFMKKYYCGYGHGSIGKCGSSKLFLSGVSMIAINHLQNLNPLYAGQESSTRYITFGDQNIVTPEPILRDPEAKETFDAVISFLMAEYRKACEKVLAHLQVTLERPTDVSDDKWLRTLKARTFDICRSLLPAGCKTVGVWDGTLEEFKDHINILHNHENEEVVAMAKELGSKIKEAYPNSFADGFPVTNSWLQKASRMLPDTGWSMESDPVMSTDAFDAFGFEAATRDYAFWEMARYDRMPDFVGKFGNVNFSYSTDFGSYRDLNRHRKGVTQRSLMAPGSFHSWYQEALEAAGVDITEIINAIYGHCEELKKADIPGWAIEYVLPMGSIVEVETSYPIDNALYVTHLRSGKTVHPTARQVAIGMAKELKTLCNFPVYANLDVEDDLDVKRADQTITIKE